MTQPSREQLRQELGAGGPPPEKAPAKLAPVVMEKPKLIKLHHHDTCPGLRNRECSCEANLVWLAESGVKALERKTQTWVEVELVDGKKLAVPKTVELWRVDNGRDHMTTVPGRSITSKPVEKLVKLPPRWVCASCGWAGRGSDLSHRCDKTAVARATRIDSVAALLTSAERYSGAYRLVIWQDAELVYHLAEEYIVDGKVERLVEIESDGHFDVIQGALISGVVDRFAP